MTDYIRVPLATDAQDVYDQQVADLQVRQPGWVPADTNLDNALLEASSFVLATLLDVAGAVQDTIFRYALSSLFGIPPDPASFATVTSTWVMVDNAGYTIGADTEVKVDVTGDRAIGFKVLEEVIVAPGDTSTLAGEVVLIALEDGADATGLSGAADLVTPIEGPTTITLVGVSIGGRDEELDADFLTRGRERLRRLTFGLVLPADVEAAVREVDGIERVLVLDQFVPPATTGAAGALTIVPIDAAGLAVTGIPLAEAMALLEASREQGFLFNSMAPSYTAVDVDFTATSYPDYVAATVEADAIAAVEAFLSPATWGRLPYGDQRTWRADPSVRYGEIYAVLNNVDGLDHVTALTLEGLANTDVALTGYAALPTAGAVTGAVT